MSKWHETGDPYIKVLQVEHNFPIQSVICPPGAGRGIVEVLNGEPQVHPCVTEICKLDFVFYVIVEEGLLFISVNPPRHWNQVLGEIQHIVARHLEKKKK